MLLRQRDYILPRIVSTEPPMTEGNLYYEKRVPVTVPE